MATKLFGINDLVLDGFIVVPVRVSLMVDNSRTSTKPKAARSRRRAVS